MHIGVAFRDVQTGHYLYLSSDSLSRLFFYRKSGNLLGFCNGSSPGSLETVYVFGDGFSHKRLETV
jgi:hypothetical protein